MTKGVRSYEPEVELMITNKGEEYLDRLMGRADSNYRGSEFLRSMGIGSRDVGSRVHVFPNYGLSRTILQRCSYEGVVYRPGLVDEVLLLGPSRLTKQIVEKRIDSLQRHGYIARWK